MLKLQNNKYVNQIISARNSLKNVYALFRNQLGFGKNLNSNISNVYDHHLPALESKTSSKLVSKTLDVLHNGRHNYIKSQASTKIKQTLKL